MKKIKISGLGWYGRPLAHALMKSGFDVSGTTRTPEKMNELQKEGLSVSLLSWPALPEVADADIVVLNIPPFEEQPEWFKSWSWNTKTWVIFISSTSVYPSPESKSAKILKEEEDWVSQTFEKWTILRFGGLIGNGRHPGKYLSGRTNLQNRLWPVNLIHLDDTIGATLAVISKGISNSVIHVVSGEHPTREDYYSDYCRKNNLPLPHFDQSDLSTGKIVPDDELKKFYVPLKAL